MLLPSQTFLGQLWKFIQNPGMLPSKKYYYIAVEAPYPHGMRYHSYAVVGLLRVGGAMIKSPTN
jgi:hypothetical protein